MTKQDTRPSFASLMAAIERPAVLALMKETAAEFESRMAFEHLEHPGNTGIQAKFAVAKAKMVTEGTATVMLAAGVKPTFLNRSVTTGRRFNIYSVEKLADLVHWAGGAVLQNPANRAVMKSLLLCEANGVPFTGLLAQGAISNKVKIDQKVDKFLKPVRHSVSVGTAATQSSSTMNALMTLGVVRNTGTHRASIWTFTEAPLTEHMKGLLAA